MSKLGRGGGGGEGPGGGPGGGEEEDEGEAQGGDRGGGGRPIGNPTSYDYMTGSICGEKIDTAAYLTMYIYLMNNSRYVDIELILYIEYTVPAPTTSTLPPLQVACYRHVASTSATHARITMVANRRLELPAVAAEQLHLLRCAPGTAALGTHLAHTGNHW